MRTSSGLLRTLLLLLLTVLVCLPSAAAAEDAAEGSLCGEGRTWWPALEDCITLPVLKKKVDPDYQLSEPGLHYGVILFVKVLSDGTVGEVQILKAPTEGEPSEDGEAALPALVQAVRLWQFSPGLGPDGRPIAISVALRVNLRTEG
jgi:hypothetical protein